jgi:hypothetical protein
MRPFSEVRLLYGPGDRDHLRVSQGTTEEAEVVLQREMIAAA